MPGTLYVSKRPVLVALSGFVDNSGAGLRQVLVECQGSNADDKVQFVNKVAMRTSIRFPFELGGGE